MTYTDQGSEAKHSTLTPTHSPSWLNDYLQNFFSDHSPSELHEALQDFFSAFLSSPEFTTLTPQQRANHLFMYERIRSLIDFTHSSVFNPNQN